MRFKTPVWNPKVFRASFKSHGKTLNGFIFIQILPFENRKGWVLTLNLSLHPFKPNPKWFRIDSKPLLKEEFQESVKPLFDMAYIKTLLTYAYRITLPNQIPYSVELKRKAANQFFRVYTIV